MPFLTKIDIATQIKDDKINIKNEDLNFEKINSLHDLLKEAVSKELSDEVMGTAARELKIEADRLIQTYNKEIELLDKLTLLLNKQKKEDMIKFGDKHLINKEISHEQRLNSIRTIYSAAFSFDEKLNLFLYGENIPKKAIFVVESKKNELSSYELDFKDLLELIDYEGRFTRKTISTLQNKRRQEGQASLEALENNKQKDNSWDNKVILSRAAYKGAVNRLNRYYTVRQQAYTSGVLGPKKLNKKGEEIKTLQKQGGYLLWKKHNEWQHIQITNNGDLKEGYTSMLFAEHADYLNISIQGTEPYYPHELIDKYVSYIQGVTNKPVVLEEDIVINGKQYGIKSFKAALPAFSQYLDTAKIVVNFFNNNNLTRERIIATVNTLYDQDAKRNIQKEVEEEIKTNVFDVIKKDFLT